jgi:uncharacterized membrane protein
LSSHKGTDFLFRVGLIVKGVDAVFEMIGGVLLSMPVKLARYLLVLSEHELYKNHKALSGNLGHLAASVQRHPSLPEAAYLLVHGGAKVILIVAIFRGKKWGYTGLIGVLSFFTIIELGRAITAHEIVTGCLGLFDLGVVLLIAKEYLLRFVAKE